MTSYTTSPQQYRAFYGSPQNDVSPTTPSEPRLKGLMDGAADLYDSYIKGMSGLPKAMMNPDRWKAYQDAAESPGFFSNSVSTVPLSENQVKVESGQTPPSAPAKKPAASSVSNPIEFSQDRWAADANKRGMGMSQGKGGDVEYLLNEQGRPVRYDVWTGNTSALNNLTHNTDGANPLAAETAARLARQQQGMGMQQPAQAPSFEGPDYSAAMDEMNDIALNSGPNGNMTPGQFAAAKHRQTAASHVAAQLANLQSQADQGRQSAAQAYLHDQTTQRGQNMTLQGDLAKADSDARKAAVEQAYHEKQLELQGGRNADLAAFMSSKTAREDLAAKRAAEADARTREQNSAMEAAYVADQTPSAINLFNWGVDSPERQAFVRSSIRNSGLGIANPNTMKADPDFVYSAFGQ